MSQRHKAHATHFFGGGLAEILFSREHVFEVMPVKCLKHSIDGLLGGKGVARPLKMLGKVGEWHPGNGVVIQHEDVGKMSVILDVHAVKKDQADRFLC